jgi:hypothetical protein
METSNLAESIGDNEEKLVTNDDYARGALVLAQSIRQIKTKRKLVVLISNQLSGSIKVDFIFSIHLKILYVVVLQWLLSFLIVLEHQQTTISAGV